MNVEIRDAQEGDIQAIIKLRKQIDDLHAQLMPDLFSSTYMYSEEDVRAYFRAEKSRVIVVEDPDTTQVAAYAVLNTERLEARSIFKSKSTIYVNDLCVRDDVRGKGIGRALMEYIIMYAKESNVDTVELHVFASNEPAVRLYESMGLKDLNKRMVLNL